MSTKEGTSTAPVAKKIIVRYEECNRNQRANMGNCVTDGCKEFMAMRTDPLACDACGCHRNFHKKRLVEEDEGEASDNDSEVTYEECCKNHAISSAKYSYEDGCLEFMPKEGSEPGSKAALTCDACTCHRNFHKKKVGKEKVLPRPSPPASYVGRYDSDDYYD